MLQFTDEALILTVDKFGDHDAIVHLFTPAYGLCKGVVKRGLSNKNRADLQPATLVEATWKAPARAYGHDYGGKPSTVLRHG